MADVGISVNLIELIITSRITRDDIIAQLPKNAKPTVNICAELKLNNNRLKDITISEIMLIKNLTVNDLYSCINLNI